MSEIDYDALELIALDMLWLDEFAQLSKVFVPGEGDNPSVFIVGEAPGAEEEVKRRPFVGRAGKVQRQLMASAGLWTRKSGPIGDRATMPNCWLTNVLKFRPPRNRKPLSTEVQAARPFLRREWKAVGRPRVIVPVGGTALSAIIGRQVGILKHSGWLHEEVSRVDGKPLYVWPMIHPSFGLREKSLQSLIEKDWTEFGRWLAENPRLYSQ